ncbi:MAG: alpha/beta hydrolase [Actinomycetota bacterium]|nr:alpha/beta hydrolase [Actinomycetota bacterium]
MPRPALAALAALLLAAPAASAATRVPGVPAAGPAKYDASHVTKIGPASAKTVLVLVPGYSGGAGGFTMVGRDIVERVPGLQVWAVDRRSQALEDTSMFERGLRGEASLQQVYDYYLGWITDSSKTPRFTPPDPASLSFAKDWGLPTHIGDLRKVILAAKRGGRRVILGGHSLGASMTAIYAAWDFRGRPGYRDVDGLVLIDGGALGTFDDSESVREMRERVAALDDQPFADLVGLGLPWAQGVFAGIGGLYAAKDPTGRSPFVDDPLLPAMFKPDFQVTNRALLGYAFDQSTSPQSLGLIHLRAGGLAASGDPRDWESGEVSPIARVADFWAQQPVNGVEWYFPQRLSIDVDGANELRRNAVTRLLKLRPWHLRRVNVPLYAFETDLTDGRVLRGARRYMQRSGVPRRASTLVDRGSTTSHLDPLTAAPETNDFLETVVPFLKRTMRRR